MPADAFFNVVDGCRTQERRMLQEDRHETELGRSREEGST